MYCVFSKVAIILFFIFLGQQLTFGQVDPNYLDSLINEIEENPSSSQNFQLSKELLDYSEKINYASGIDIALVEIIDYYESRGDYVNSIEMYQKLLQLGISERDTSIVSEAYIGLGRTYLGLELREESDDYLRETLTISNEIQDSSLLAYIYSDLGLLYMEMDSFLIAIEYFNLSKDLYRRFEQENSFPVINNNLAISYVKTGKVALAIPYFKEYLEFILEENDSLNLAFVYENLAWSYQNLDSLEKAFSYYDSTLIYTKKYNQSEVAFYANQDLSDAYLMKKDYKNALKHYKEFHRLKDSIVNFKAKQSVNLMKIKFETEKKEKEIIKKQNELDHQLFRSQFLVFGLISTIIISILFFIKLRNDAKRKIELQKIEEELMLSRIKNKELETEQLQKELINQQQDLTNFAIDISRKNEFSIQLIEKLEQLQHARKEISQEKLREVIMFLSNHLKINEDLALLQENVNQINHAFYEKLDDQFQNLSANDKYMLGLVRLNLSNKDISSIKGISVGSAKVMRYRLRKKLNLKPEIDIAKFLQNL